jgi:hypothetical protein
LIPGSKTSMGEVGAGLAGVILASAVGLIATLIATQL